MPVANCFIKDCPLNQRELDEMAREWADEIRIDPKDVSLTIIPDFMQSGETFKAMVNLFLPSLWQEQDIRRIQKSLMKLLINRLNIEPREIFILTSIILSGHVVEDGEIVEW